MGLTWLKFLVPLFFVLASWGFGSQFVTDYRSMSAEIATLKHDKEIMLSRENALRASIERRNQAIEKSTCSKQIQFWLKNPQHLPSAIPQPFTFGPHAP